MHVRQAFHQRAQVLSRFLLRLGRFLFGHLGAEISTVSEPHDNIAISLCFKNFVCADDVWMLQILSNEHLSLQAVDDPQLIVLIGEVENLDGHQLPDLQDSGRFLRFAFVYAVRQ